MDLETALPEAIRVLPPIDKPLPSAPDGRSMIEHVLKASGCEVFFTAAPAGAGLPMHSHDTENVAVIVSGETVVLTDEGERRCGPGDWYTMRPGEMHGLRFAADTVQIELMFSDGSS